MVTAPSSSDGSAAPLPAASTAAAEAKAKRRRTLIACERCRQHKLRCLGGPKPCTACSKRGVGESCEFVAEVRRRGKAKKGRPAADGAGASPGEGMGPQLLDERPSSEGPNDPSRPGLPDARGIVLACLPAHTGSGPSEGTSRRSSASGHTPQPPSMAAQTGPSTGTDGSWSSETRASLSSVGLHAGICAGGEWEERELTSGLLDHLQGGARTEEMAPP
jgi:hypothetical protein